MVKSIVLLVMAISFLLAACASGAPESARTASSQSAAATAAPMPTASFGGPPGAMGPAGPAGAPGFSTSKGFDGADQASGEFFFDNSPAEAPAPRPGAFEPLAPVDEDSGASSSALETAQRQVISVASVSIEVEVVPASVTEVRVIAESLGGFVEQLSSSGGAERQQATMTIRVPQDQFFNALERIEAMGEVQNRNLGSEDVSERFIDLKARLQSSLREEESLLALLQRAGTVSEILTIERELARVRSEIERAQGQLNFLERRVALATITVSLFPPGQQAGEPPAASLVIETSRASDRAQEVKDLVLSLNGSVDQMILSVREGRQRANISVRVFPDNFGQAVASLEGMGKVRTKEVREGTVPENGEITPPERPNAPIHISFEASEPSDTGLIVALAASIGGVVLAILLAGAFVFVYRKGRGRRVEA